MHLKFHYVTQLHALSHSKRDSYKHRNNALQQLTELPGFNEWYLNNRLHSNVCVMFVLGNFKQQETVGVTCCGNVVITSS